MKIRKIKFIAGSIALGIIAAAFTGCITWVGLKTPQSGLVGKSVMHYDYSTKELTVGDKISDNIEASTGPNVSDNTKNNELKLGISVKYKDISVQAKYKGLSIEEVHAENLVIDRLKDIIKEIAPGQKFIYQGIRAESVLITVRNAHNFTGDVTVPFKGIDAKVKAETKDKERSVLTIRNNTVYYLIQIAEFKSKGIDVRYFNNVNKRAFSLTDKNTSSDEMDFDGVKVWLNTNPAMDELYINYTKAGYISKPVKKKLNKTNDNWDVHKLPVYYYPIESNGKYKTLHLRLRATKNIKSISIREAYIESTLYTTKILEY